MEAWYWAWSSNPTSEWALRQLCRGMALLWLFVLLSHFLVGSCYVLDTSSLVPTHVFVNNNQKSIRRDRWGEARQVKIKDRYIAYFSSDQGER